MYVIFSVFFVYIFHMYMYMYIVYAVIVLQGAAAARRCEE